jgi:hypothetical protein
MHILVELQSENLRERNHFQNINVHGTDVKEDIIKMDLKSNE